jgi:rRNA maturation protein Nop10
VALCSECGSYAWNIHPWHCALNVAVMCGIYTRGIVLWMWQLCVEYTPVALCSGVAVMRGIYTRGIVLWMWQLCVGYTPVELCSECGRCMWDRHPWRCALNVAVIRWISTRGIVLWMCISTLIFRVTEAKGHPSKISLRCRRLNSWQEGQSPSTTIKMIPLFWNLRHNHHVCA